MRRVNVNHNRRRSLTQKQKILKFLQEGGTLTPTRALSLCGTTKLSTRVSELITKEGHTEIIKEWVWVLTDDGDMAHVMSYRIHPQVESGKPEYV